MSHVHKPVYIVAAKRTPVVKARGVFRYTRPDDLLAHVLQAVLQDTPSISPESIEDVIIGCAMPEGAQGMNVARIGLLLANLPDSVPGMTINRFCSSGLQAIALAADRIALGEADVMIAGGTESMTMVPMGGYRYEANPHFFDHNEEHVAIAFGMGITAERVANRWHISREQQDNFALQSHQRAVAAIKAGYFKDEISPVDVDFRHADLMRLRTDRLNKVIAMDDGPRADTSIEALAKLRSVFAAKGTVTAGNSSQMSDGAAALILVSEAALKRYKLKPLARFHGFSVAGVAPDVMGIGPIAAIPKVLTQTGLTLEDIDWIELNEAFAAQSLAVIQELGLDPSKVNPYGGAIALGHPLGATGAVRACTLIHGLARTKQRYGMITMCIGTGMGAAGILERL